jgi:hypothetical protein
MRFTDRLFYTLEIVAGLVLGLGLAYLLAVQLPFVWRVLRQWDAITELLK